VTDTIHDLWTAIMVGKTPDFAWVVEHLPAGTLDAAWASPAGDIGWKVRLLILLRERHNLRLRRFVFALVRFHARRVSDVFAVALERQLNRLLALPASSEAAWDRADAAMRAEVPRHQRALVEGYLEFARRATYVITGNVSFVDGVLGGTQLSRAELLALLLATVPAPTYDEVLAAIEGKWQ